MHEGKCRECPGSLPVASKARNHETVCTVSKTRTRKECSLSKDCMKCNVIATRVRRKIQLLLFGLGCRIQKNNLFTFVTGFIILLGLCVGLKKAQEETNLQRLWVQAGGRLQREIDYTEKFYGKGGFQTSIEAFIQKNKWGSQNILSVESLEEHLQMMQRVMSMNVYVHQDQWSLSDLCQKQSFGEVSDSYLHFDRLLEHFTPCHIITPLDCFWEGSKIAGPEQPLKIPIGRRRISWGNVDPTKLVDDLIKANITMPVTRLRKIFERAGIKQGYLGKPCLNPRSTECPGTAANSGKKQLQDIGKILTDGCSGVASNIMKWPEDLIVGGVTKDRKGFIQSAKALQSIIFLLSPKDVFFKHRHSKGRSVRGWSPYKAEQVIKTWQREYTKLINSLGFNNDSTSTQMLAFSSTSFYDLIKNFSKTNLAKIGLGYGLMALYAIVTLKRWTDSVFSYGLVGLVGVVVVSLSVGAALGFCALLQLSFNAASTQILPFLALGLGVDDMFIVARTYVDISEAGETEESELLGECLEKSGLSVTLTSLTNAVAFAVASIVPVPALQVFARQAAIIVVFNYLTVLFVFTSTLAFDIKRIKQKSYDLLICFGREQHEQTPHVSPRMFQQDIAVINLDGHGDGPSICAGASVAAYVEEDKTPKSRSFTIRTDTQKGPFGGPWSSQNVFSGPCRPKQRQSKPKVENESKVCTLLKKLSFSYFADVYFSLWLQAMPIKIFILFVFAVFVGICAYGAFQVTNGLNPSEMVPKGSAEHQFVDTRFKYFSFYQMYAVTMEKMDYPNKQKLLYNFHRSIEQLENVVVDRKHNGRPFWLMYLRQWLLDVQSTFQKEWSEGRFFLHGWYRNASRDAVIGYKLLLVTGDEQKPQDFSRIPNGRLVEQDGIIPPSCFYHYLTAWYNVDVMGYQASEMGLRPRPPLWSNFMDRRLPINSTENLIPKSPPIQIALMPFYSKGLVTNEDFLKLIKDFRQVCTDFSNLGIPSYPQGLPFTYWEQYVNLDRHLWLSVGLIFAVTFIVLSLSLMNVWAAVITTIVLASITFELFGVIGLLGLKLSAVPVVTIIMSVGIGVEFTVHICLAFVSAQGNRNERIKTAVTRLFTPILDGVMSTFLGIIMLANSDFDFVRRYFFDLILALVLIGAANGLLLLPVLLSFFGPCCEVTHRRVNPTHNDVIHPNLSQLENTGVEFTHGKNKSPYGDEGTIILHPLDHEPVRLPRTRTLLKQNQPQIKAGDPLGNLKSSRDPFTASKTPRDLGSSRTRKQKYPGNVRVVTTNLSPVPEVNTPDGSDSGRISRASTSTAKPSRPGTPIAACLPLHERGNDLQEFEVEDFDDGVQEMEYAPTRNLNRKHCPHPEDFTVCTGSKLNSGRLSRSQPMANLHHDISRNKKDFVPDYAYRNDRTKNNYPGKPCLVSEIESDEESTEQVTKVTATATVTVELRSQQTKPHRIQRVYHGTTNDPYHGCGLPEPQ